MFIASAPNKGQCFSSSQNRGVDVYLTNVWRGSCRAVTLQLHEFKDHIEADKLRKSIVALEFVMEENNHAKYSGSLTTFNLVVCGALGLPCCEHFSF